MSAHAPQFVSQRPAPSGNAARWLVLLTTLLVVVAVALSLGRFYLERHRLSWITDRGKQLLDAARTVVELEAALNRWDDETRDIRDARLDPWLATVFAQENLADVRIRRMLVRATSFDFVDRVDDWTRWFDTRKRMREGRPLAPQREHVTLEPRWRAPVGLTSWYTTILPLDGYIFVASLGAGFDDRTDDADGIVRVHGASGAAELFFVPADPGPRDVLGIAAGRDCLFAACRNGFLYCVGRNGGLVWKSSCGSAIASIPLVVDANRDDVPDVCVATSTGRVILVNGSNGKPVWVTPLDGIGGDPLAAVTGLAEQRACPIALSLGDLPGVAGPSIIVTSAAGPVVVLSAANGRVQWRQNVNAGAGGALYGPGVDAGPPTAILADMSGRVGLLARQGRDLALVPIGALDDCGPSGVLATPRPLPIRGVASPAVLACSTGALRGAAEVFTSTGRRWRCPLPGVLQTAPAIADINADGVAEIVFATSDPSASPPSGALAVVSANGHYLRLESFSSALAASPVVSDVDGDGSLEILVTDRSGILHSLATRRFGPVEWGVYAGDPHNTRSAANAYNFGQTPSGYQWNWRPSAPRR